MSSAVLKASPKIESFGVDDEPEEPGETLAGIVNGDRLSLIRQIQSLIPGYMPREDLSIEQLKECLEWCWSPEY